jgi:phage/plasmid-like protein (TIGR03299 family)
MAKNYTFKGLNMRGAASLGEAVEKYGMDFSVGKYPLYFFPEGPDGPKILSPQNEQVANGDNYDPLGVVGLRYTKVPYPLAFAPAESLIEGGARVVGGGCPNNGERAYLVLESDGVIQLSRGDKIVNRFVMMSSHDGTGKIEIRMTPFRPKTGTAITYDASHPLAFKHTRNVNTKLGRAKTIFSRVNANWNEFSVGVQRMVSVNMTEAEAKDFIEAVLPTSTSGGAKREASARLENIRTDVLVIYRDTGIGTRLPKCRNTLFGLVQAFTEWADITRTVRKSTRRDAASAGLDARLVSDSAKKKQKAWALALYLAKNTKMAGALSR